MVSQEQSHQETQPAASQAPAQQPAFALNGHTASIHEQYLQAAQEFNRAVAALAQVEQDLVRISNQNGNHQHLEVVVDRISRLMAHQEAMLNIHTAVLMNAPAPSTPAAPPVQQFSPPAQPVAQPQPVYSPPVAQQPTPVVQPAAAPAVESKPEPVIEQKPAPEPVAESTTSSSGIDQILLRVVSEKTGYPEETLELTMSMEADLGIDSIKRVEILGAMQEELPDIDEIDMEELNSLTTLQDVVSFLEKQISTVPSKKA